VSPQNKQKKCFLTCSENIKHISRPCIALCFCICLYDAGSGGVFNMCVDDDTDIDAFAFAVDSLRYSTRQNTQRTIQQKKQVCC
jgi:hypothetical protein